MKRKVFGTVLAVFFLMGASVYAQQAAPAAPVAPAAQPKQQPPTAQSVVEKMQKQLNLTPQQVTALTPVVEDTMAKRKQIKESLKLQGADKKALHQQLIQVNKGEEDAFSKILTPEQMKMLRDMRAKRMSKHSHLKGAVKDAPVPAAAAGK